MKNTNQIMQDAIVLQAEHYSRYEDHGIGYRRNDTLGTRGEFHPQFFPYVNLVSGNCIDDIFVLCSVPWKSRARWSERASARLLTLQWYSTMVEYKHTHILYITRHADRLRWAKLYVALAESTDSIYHANLYDSTGLGYSGPAWYGRIMYPLVDEESLDRYCATPTKAIRPVRSALALCERVSVVVAPYRCESSLERAERMVAVKTTRENAAAAAAAYSRQRADEKVAAAAELAASVVATRALTDKWEREHKQQ